MQEIDELTDRFHTTEATSHNDECCKPPALRYIRLELGLLQTRNDPVAQKKRIAEGLQGEGVLSHSLDQVEVGVRATGEHQLIVAERSWTLPEILHRPGVGVDFRNLRHAHQAAM